MHSHEDDKGAIAVSYAELAKSTIAQEMTTADQYFDNNTQRNQAPWIMPAGSIRIRSKVFTAGGNRIWTKKQGAEDPHIVKIEDTKSPPRLPKKETNGEDEWGTVAECQMCHTQTWNHLTC